jgi:hypothetical protein
MMAPPHDLRTRQEQTHLRFGATPVCCTGFSRKGRLKAVQRTRSQLAVCQIADALDLRKLTITLR